MNDKAVFIDTNILVYAHDRQAGAKWKRACEIIKEAWHRPYPPAISVQVLQEFYITLLRKEVAAVQAQEVVRNLYRWEIVPNDTALLEKGFEAQKRWKLSFWDSLIVAAAIRAKAAVLWSEDFSAGQRFDSVKVVNPLIS